MILDQGGALIDMGPIWRWLSEKGYQDSENEGLLIEGWAVQFIPAFNPLTRNALVQAIPIDLEEVPTRIFSQEHLMAICLDTGRQKDFSRLGLFLSNDSYDKDLFMEIVNQFALAEKWATYMRKLSSL